ncbi:MAG: hypothetical protein ACRDQB_02835 [Thermocrispum sp.]
MRTTVTLDPEVLTLVRKLMTARGLSFKEAVNTAIRAGLAPSEQEQARTPTFSMGIPKVPVEHALRVAAELEDDELRRKLSTGR